MDGIAEHSFQSVIGPITVKASERGLREVRMHATPAGSKATRITTTKVPRVNPRADSAARRWALQAAVELEEYFAGKRASFSVPLDLRGTTFQRQVWSALSRIPYGETRSYAEVAGMIGRPKACRAVGMANRSNPVAIIVPCHRVIASDGSLGGYASGLDRKTQLLMLERAGATWRAASRIKGANSRRDGSAPRTASSRPERAGFPASA